MRPQTVVTWCLWELLLPAPPHSWAPAPEMGVLISEPWIPLPHRLENRFLHMSINCFHHGG